LTLEVDDYGNVFKSVAIGYQRRLPSFDEQKQTLATLIDSHYTNAALEDDAYRTPLPAEVKTYELTAPTLTGAGPLDFAAVQAMAAAASEIAYEEQPISGQTQKRLIEQLRILYRKNDLSALLPTGGTTSALTTPPNAIANDAVPRCNPKSAMIGFRNTPKVKVSTGPLQTKRPVTAPTTTHQGLVNLMRTTLLPLPPMRTFALRWGHHIASAYRLLGLNRHCPDSRPTDVILRPNEALLR
jgi:hypothetical protein